MTQTRTNTGTDPLLLAGKVLAILLQGTMVIGALALIIASVAVLFFRETLIAEFAEDIGNPDVVFPVFALLGVFIIGLAIVGGLFIFFGKLRHIINTVSEGDPFLPINADRLSMMGWLMLGVQLLILPLAALGAQLAKFADELDDVDVSGGMELDLTGILIVILLFILARVFKHGAAMREDLEGTV